MKPIELLVSEERGCDRSNFMLEQGIPVQPIQAEKVASLGIVDDQDRPVSANIQVEGTDQDGNVRWVLVSFPVNLKAGQKKKFWLKETGAEPSGNTLKVDESAGSVAVTTPYLTFRLNSSGEINVSTAKGEVLAGAVSMLLRADARSAVGNQRPVHYEAEKVEILEQTSKRVKLLLTGKYRAYTPKSSRIDPVLRYDTELEMVIYSDSPVIRFKWRITNHIRFNCAYMWLDRYIHYFPLPGGSRILEGAQGSNGVPFADWIQIETPGGCVAMTAPLTEWVGKGAGIEVTEAGVGQGGIKPPPDGGFGGEVPDIRRKFFNGMSRTFEGSLLFDATRADIDAELRPIPIILSPEHYSACGELPEGGDPVTFGPWKDVIDRAAEWLVHNQWKGTLWHGEWWREIDVTNENLGIEETHSGNSALGPLYHFYRTGDWRFWQCAKLSCLFTYDIQFCKREDYDGPYMHTRRFLLDHQEWFHTRYQRVGGIIKPSHLFGDRRIREKTFWMLRFWAEKYIDKDGTPLLPDGRGNLEKVSERAMAIIGESMALAYTETGDKMFFDASNKIADWVEKSFRTQDWENVPQPELVETTGINSNATRYIMQGLLPMCKMTEEQRFKDLFVTMSDWTNNSPRYHFGTHYFAFHFYLASMAYKFSGKKKLLEDILDVARWVLSCESKERPGTYPFTQKGQVPPAQWICSYDNIAITAYLPVLASTLTEAGVPVE